MGVDLLSLPVMLALAAVTDAPTDAELVDRARRGDRAAFGELVLRWQDRVHGVCRRWLGDPVAAEETAQEVFLSAWRALDGFRAEASFGTWVRRIAVNKSRHRRTRHRRRAHDRHDSLSAPATDDGPHLQLVHPGRGADVAVDHREAADVLQAALDQLDPDHREILVLRELEDLGYDEIGDLLDLPRGTVKSRLHRARLALTEALGRHIGPEDVFG